MAALFSLTQGGGGGLACSPCSIANLAMQNMQHATRPAPAGNDMSRSFGWGGEFTGGSLSYDTLSSMLMRVRVRAGAFLVWGDVGREGDHKMRCFAGFFTWQLEAGCCLAALLLRLPGHGCCAWPTSRW